MDRQYWNSFFTKETWTEFLAHGARTTGFRGTKFSAARRIRPGDRLLCYVSGEQRCVAVLEAQGDAYWSDEWTWTNDLFPVRVDVRPRRILSLQTGVEVHRVAPRLREFQNLADPRQWGSVVRRSPKLWKWEDGWSIEDEILAVG